MAVGSSAMKDCPEPVQEALGRRVLSAADGTAADADALVSHLRRVDGAEWPASFVSGLLLETIVHEEGRVRLKSRLLAEVVETVAAHPRRDKIVERMQDAVASAETENRRSVLRCALEELDESHTTVGQDVVDAIAAALRGALSIGTE
jgi:hypothetical protein